MPSSFDAPKSDAPKSDAPKAAPRPTATTAEDKAAAKTFDEQLKSAKASVQAAPDSDVKAEAQRDIEAAERLYADGHTERAQAALRQATAVVPKA